MAANCRKSDTRPKATQDSEFHAGHQVPQNKISKFLSSVHNHTLVHAERLLNLEHGESANPNKAEGPRLPSKRAPKHAYDALDSANPTSRLKRQLSECSKARRPLDATPLGRTESYEEAKLNLQRLASSHSSNNFHPRAFTSKRATASLPCVTHLVPRSILTESLPQKPAENYLFKALPRPPTEGQVIQSGWTTDLGRSSSAPTRVRFADPMVHYSPTPSAPESCQFSPLEPFKHTPTRQKTEPTVPKSCIKSTGKPHFARGNHSHSAVYTHSLPPLMLCDSPLQEEFCASISFMADLIFPKELDHQDGNEPSGGGGAGRAERTSLNAGPSSISSNVGKEVHSRSTIGHKLDLSKPRELQESSRKKPSDPARSALPVPTALSKSPPAPSTSSIQDSHSHQPKQEKLLSVPPRQLEKDCSQYANDYREKTTPKFSMSPKIKRVEVTTNLQGTAVQLQQGKKIGKVVTGESSRHQGSKGLVPNSPSQPPGNRKLDAIADLPSPIVDDEHRSAVMLQVQVEETTNLGKRSFRERTDRSPTVSPRLASPLTLPPRESRKESIICSDSPPHQGHSSPKRLKVLRSRRSSSAKISPRLDSKVLILETEVSPEDTNAEAQLSSSPSISSEAPSTSSRIEFSPVPSPQAQVATTLDSWNDHALDDFDDACNQNHQPEARSPCAIDGRDEPSPCKTPFQCVIVSEPEVLLPRALGDFNCEAKTPLEIESVRFLDRPNNQSEPEPVPRELLGIFGEEKEDRVVERPEETETPGTRREQDIIEAGTDQSKASATIRPQCFCKCSKRWENWNLYLRDKEEEPMKCYSQSSASSAGRSSISIHTDNSFLWDSAPQIAIIKPDDCLFSELKSPPIYSEGLRYSAIVTAEDADGQYVGKTIGIENERKFRLDVEDPHEAAQVARYDNLPSEDQNQVHISSQELRDGQPQDQSTSSNLTTIIVKPPVVKKRSLAYQRIETHDIPKTPSIHRRRRDNHTGTASGKGSDARTRLSSPEISSSLALKAAKTTSVSPTSPFELIKGDRTIVTKFELSILRFPQILYRILVQLDYQDFFRLNQVSRVLRMGFGREEVKETVLKVFLSDLGYCDSLPPDFQTYIIRRRFRSPSPMAELNREDLAPGAKSLSKPSLRTDINSTNLAGGAMSELLPRKRKMDSSNPLDIDLKELHAFHYFRQPGQKGFFDLANQPTSHRLLNNLSITQAYCSLHNKLVIRARLQFEDSSNSVHQFRDRGFHSEIFSPGRVVVFRLWMPSVKKSMSKADLLKCEVEMLRSGLNPFVRKGDIFWNAALGSSDNVGRLIYDGQHLQELQDLWDPVGHLPDWLNMFLFPPSFYHHTIKSSNLNPIFYLDLTDFKEQLISSLSLVESHESLETSQDPSQQGMLNYLGLVEIRAGMKTGVIEGIECFRDTSDSYMLQEFIHPDWVGKLMIEIQVSSIERLQQLFSKFDKAKLEDLLNMGVDQSCSSNQTRDRALSHLKSAQLSPWRIIRQKSSPGMVWIRRDSEKTFGFENSASYSPSVIFKRPSAPLLHSGVISGR
ncbi:hypothetical protein PtA15_15A365 [Puccinia triticina]|uniref:F-box domain-containing protein n=1 Tax=Puccinia triticina TaxID=208348 RepID=A0ABY7D5L5_9BASI|nr:uncharacterized protein PtA15_15A365 [Puccinia triticina]WAQ91972.1 hypothetical protein PtA15_15A365 [Puccinia triticina]